MPKQLRFSTILILILALSAAFTEAGVIERYSLNLMPVPSEISISDGKFIVDSKFTVVTEKRSRRLEMYASRVLKRVSDRIGIALDNGYDVKTYSEQKSLVLKHKRGGLLKAGEDESYRLTVNSDGAVIEADTDFGVMRGLETFMQLLVCNREGGVIPHVKINDKPSYTWRGLMIDSCRHFMPIEVIKRNIDAMAAVKLNVFHWHLSEDQGFRVECKSFPGLHRKGSDGLYYTQAQIRDIVSYAGNRGIRVVPEFDIPGHSTSWFVAYPEYASSPGPYSIERKWGVFDPTFDPTEKKTYKFFQKFLKEMTSLFPDEYFHIGGDENNGKQWKENKKIQAWMKKNGIKDKHELQAYFNKKIQKILMKNGKKMIGWDEIFRPGIPKDIVLQSWRGYKSLRESAKKGYYGILSNGYYIDLCKRTSHHYNNHPVPPGSDLTDSERRLILGGEATMWAEMITEETIDSRIWPRTAAIAERLWSPAEVTDTESMYRRLDAISVQLEEHGLLHIKNREMMMRRLTGGRDISALKTLIDLVEPLKGYKRHRKQKLTSRFPLSRIVDIAVPDPSGGRAFGKLVKDFLVKKDKASLEVLKLKLEELRDNHIKLEPLFEQSKPLGEIEKLSLNLKNTAELGLTAVEMISKGSKDDGQWKERALNIIKKAEPSIAEVELMILQDIRKLAEAI